MNDPSPTSAIRASNDPKFYARFKWLGLAMLGFMLYCLYDGCVKYPAQQERALAYQQLMTEHEESGKTEDEAKAAWKSLSAERDWPIDQKIKMRTDADIVTQYLMAAFAGIAGVWMWLKVWRSNGTWIEASDVGLASHEGTQIPYEQITSLDKRQWRDKGIAWAHYTETSGAKRRFLIDNYKFQREETNVILLHVEQAIDPEKITGGPAEAVGPPVVE